MIADHHAAAARCRLFLTLKTGGCAIPPMTGHAAFPLLVVVFIEANHHHREHGRIDPE
jgi:hypothetical protein